MSVKPTSKRITKSILIEHNNDLGKLTAFVNQIDKQIQVDNKPISVTWTNDVGKIRTLAQNALYACYVSAIKHKFGGSLSSIRAELKHEIGVDILMLQYLEAKEKAISKLECDQDLNYSMISQAGREAGDTHVLLKTINYELQPYNIQMKILRPLPCTSIMLRKWFVKFIEAVEMYYAEKGLVLESINETLRNEALLN